MKNGKGRRIVALITVGVLISMYGLTIVFAIMAKPYANRLFVVSIFASLIIPVLVYVYLLLQKLFVNKDKDSIRLYQRKKIKKEIEKMANSMGNEDDTDSEK